MKRNGKIKAESSRKESLKISKLFCIFPFIQHLVRLYIPRLFTKKSIQEIGGIYKRHLKTKFSTTLRNQIFTVSETKMPFIKLKNSSIQYVTLLLLLIFSCTPLLIRELEDKNFPSALKMIQDGENIQVKISDGFTSLMYASFYGELDLVKTLGTKGAKYNETSIMWWRNF